MKLFLAIFAAVLCATAVTGAPSSVEQVDGDRWINFHCVGDILKQEASPQVKALWAEYKKKLHELHDNDWEKCKKIDNIAEQQKCKAAVVEKSIGIYSEFFKKLIKIIDWNKAKEIHKKVHEKCVKYESFALFDVDFEEEMVPAMSFDLFALANPFGFEDTMRDYWINLKCARQVLAEEASPEVKALWAEYKKKLEQLRDNDWQKCKKIDNIAEQQKCKIAVVEKSIGIYSEFFTKLIKVAHWDKVREIRKKIGEKCVKHESFEVESTENSLPDQFQCAVDVIGKISEKNGLGDEWKKYQPDIQLHIDQWKKCADVENKFFRLLCNIKEGATVFRLVNTYARIVAAEKPALMGEITKEIQQKCSNKINEEDLLEFDTAALTNGLVDKIKCYTGAISEALKETSYAEPWEKFKKDLEKLGDRIKACKGENYWEWAKCVANEGKHAKDVIEKFLKELELKNKDLYERVKKYIKEKCHE